MNPSKGSVHSEEEEEEVCVCERGFLHIPGSLFSSGFMLRTMSRREITRVFTSILMDFRVLLSTNPCARAGIVRTSSPPHPTSEPRTRQSLGDGCKWCKDRLCVNPVTNSLASSPTAWKRGSRGSRRAAATVVHTLDCRLLIDFDFPLK